MAWQLIRRTRIVMLMVPTWPGSRFREGATRLRPLLSGIVSWRVASPPVGCWSPATGWRAWLVPVMVSVCITASSERGQMIARIWRGWASQPTADDYQRHYETEVSRHLQGVEGFRGARLLRRDDGQEVMFTSVAFFASIDAVRGFAGEDYEQAIVEEAARRALNRWDERVSHHEVSVDLPGAS